MQHRNRITFSLASLLASLANGAPYIRPLTADEVANVTARQTDPNTGSNPDHGIAFIVYHDQSDCGVGGILYGYSVSPITEYKVNVDQCDPGKPTYNVGTELRQLPDDFNLKSFSVSSTANTCQQDRGKLASILLYPECARTLNRKEGNWYCNCESEGWSVNDGHDVCVNTPKFGSDLTPKAFALENRITNCARSSIGAPTGHGFE